MKGLFSRLLPFLPDSVGAIAAFSGSPALVIVNDMNGTLSTFHQRVGLPEGSPMLLRSAKDVRELSYVMGRDEDFLENYRRLYAGLDFQLAVLVHGPVSSMVGVDLRGLAAQLEAELGLPVLAVESSGSGAYDEGISDALCALFDRVAAEGADAAGGPEAGTAVVVGANPIDLPGAEGREAYVRMLCGAAGARPLSRWGTGGDWEEWRRARRAERVIAASSSGLDCARAMERVWGIPCTRADELPLPRTTLGLSPAGMPGARGRRILIVGEQMEARLLRRAIAGEAADSEKAAQKDPQKERRGVLSERPFARSAKTQAEEGRGAAGQIAEAASPTDIAVASFFAMDGARMREGDARLESEGDLVQLAAARRFDAVFADPALAPCLPAGTPLFPLRNLAYGAGPASGTPRADELRHAASRGAREPWREGAALRREPTPWTPAWFAAIADFLEGL